MFLPRLSFAQEKRKFGHEFSDCDIKVAGDRTAVDVASWQREAGTRGKAFSCAAMATQYDVGRERIIRKATYRANPFSRKSLQCIARGEVMSRDVNGQVSHGALFDGCSQTAAMLGRGGYFHLLFFCDCGRLFRRGPACVCCLARMNDSSGFGEANLQREFL